MLEVLSQLLSEPEVLIELLSEVLIDQVGL